MSFPIMALTISKFTAPTPPHITWTRKKWKFFFFLYFINCKHQRFTHQPVYTPIFTKYKTIFAFLVESFSVVLPSKKHVVFFISNNNVITWQVNVSHDKTSSKNNTKQCALCTRKQSAVLLRLKICTCRFSFFFF